ncbi:hypothetical protein COY13_01300 [Candidatus Roizmanbacteria bacterium CG_4_10_14_0_2_um_filter_36_35]|uniref:NYN domain-containing protein n=5 Tax=Candidatus Roizmaniibacteriota TaxID=1752723 RepID=A0A2M8F483_9BACT|nr:MAG: hypothetical protein COX47_01755 [Candidatus Roizmanbacteria bacterium CG23_combo_of_CG06-09_8_20_14_all_35_49]PIP63153.1 MAG: hypothetical protein COW98_00170 [Candidatus Roizmanbacteria bacterium CG22_combo_CG10-13_8_21_14_all_35_9]PIY71326.1 MAG: hypothetical protein COY88_00945 [Candidatus Roizmanbacteria bacterium CG_4_10_14_0_8_um_filter_35_28]PIZ68420.1 MAG: hypothetical protein COY13_01300 [Candidatus Roizmanbacteria bacterium CG_4_10_14_0_2_um_filter_36_35]PJC34061.1 MAG: hypot
MDKTVLFIDGENFIHKVEDVLKKEDVKIKGKSLSKINLNFLLEKTLEKYKVSRKIFYVAKLHFHPKTKEKSIKLILFQRYLKTNLEKQGFEFLIAGNVRAQEIKVDHKTKLIFREKGVDVKIAVDLVSMAADRLLKTAILCSSDSDLQPAVQEARKRNVEVIYLGFEFQPNKGLTYTTDHTILFRNSEILKACGIK